MPLSDLLDDNADTSWPASATRRGHDAKSTTSDLGLLLRRGFEHSPLGMGFSDVHGRWLKVNQALCEMLGYAAEDLLAGDLQSLVQPEDWAELASDWEALRAGDRNHCQGEQRLVNRFGQSVWTSLHATLVRDGAGKPLGCTIQIENISQRKQATAELEAKLRVHIESHTRLRERVEVLLHLADSDPLTGLLNRRSFREHFDREWSRFVRHRRPLACIMLDVDFFKAVNDLHGHAAGDAVLKKIADMLTLHCRPSDLVCRYGGEEFCIVAPETTSAGAAKLAERLRAKLAESQLLTSGQCLSTTSSFGVAEALAKDDDVEQLIDRADQALRVAKLSGRNRVVRFPREAALADSAIHKNASRLTMNGNGSDGPTQARCVYCHQVMDH